MANTYLFPARGENLGRGHFWVVNEFSEGAFTLDIKVLRFDADRNKWVALRDDISQEEFDDDPTNDKILTFGIPLFAPVSGFVKSCWRNFPDNPKPGEKLPEVTGERGVTKKIFGGGNAMAIETDDGHVFFIAHMKQGTIPTNLCPFDDTFPSTMEKIGDFSKAAFIEKSKRPRVNVGDFIGNAGNSGNSGGPHIHISVKPSISDTVLGAPQAINFRRAWRHSHASNAPASRGNWEKLDGKAITSTVGNSLIFPSPFIRRDDASAGEVQRLALVVVGQRVVTAVSDSSGNLKLISWNLTAQSITRSEDAIAGSVSEVAIIQPRQANEVLTAVRESSGKLKLILWSVTAPGGIVRLDDALAEPASKIVMTTTPFINKHTVTAFRDDAGNLKLIVWDIEGNGSIIRLSNAAAGAVSAIAITPASRPDFKGIITAVRDGEGNLRLIAWDVSTDGRTIIRKGTATAGAIDLVDIVSLGSNVLTAMRDGDGNLRLIAWELSNNGNEFIRKGTAIAGSISEVSLCKVTHSPSCVVTAVRDGNGKLRLIAWELLDGGDTILRTGGTVAESATNIVIESTFLSVVGVPPRDFAIGAVQVSDGSLKVISWEVNLTP